MVKIYLDAGHGGKDNGATGNSLFEKAVTLDITKRINEHLKSYKNVETLLTRDTDIFLSLAERTDKANKWGADIFLAIHINAATIPSSRGFESHIYTSPDAKTKALQNVMHETIFKSISADTDISDRGKKQSNFHVLRESKMAAILTENLFITNSKDAAFLKKNDFKEKIAVAHVLGLEKFLGLEKNLPPPKLSDELFQVIAGTFSQKENADDLAEKLKKDGYEAYVKKQ